MGVITDSTNYNYYRTRSLHNEKDAALKSVKDRFQKEMKERVKRSMPQIEGELIHQRMRGPGILGLDFGTVQQKMWVVLNPEDDTFTCWESRGAAAPKKRLELSKLTKVDQNPYGLYLFLDFEGTFLKFKAASADEFARWISVLKVYSDEECPIDRPLVV